jgi:hypothetical protein
MMLDYRIPLRIAEQCCDFPDNNQTGMGDVDREFVHARKK